MGEPDLVVRRRVADKLGWKLKPCWIKGCDGWQWSKSHGRLTTWRPWAETEEAATESLPPWECDLAVAWGYVVPALITDGWIVNLKACDAWAAAELEHVPPGDHSVVVDRTIYRDGDRADAARLLCEAFLDAD